MLTIKLSGVNKLLYYESLVYATMPLGCAVFMIAVDISSHYSIYCCLLSPQQDLSPRKIPDGLMLRIIEY